MRSARREHPQALRGAARRGHPAPRSSSAAITEKGPGRGHARRPRPTWRPCPRRKPPWAGRRGRKPDPRALPGRCRCPDASRGAPSLPGGGSGPSAPPVPPPFRRLWSPRLLGARSPLHGRLPGRTQALGCHPPITTQLRVATLHAAGAAARPTHRTPCRRARPAPARRQGVAGAAPHAASAVVAATPVGLPPSCTGRRP